MRNAGGREPTAKVEKRKESGIPYGSRGAFPIPDTAKSDAR